MIRIIKRILDHRIFKVKVAWTVKDAVERNRIVKYYSPIDHRWLYVEVNYETYKYFDCLKKQRREDRKSRQQKFEESHFLYDPDEWFAESKYCENKKLDIARQLEEKELSNILWGTVANLETEQKEMIAAHFIYGFDFVEIADYYGRSKSGISQLFDTIYHYLKIQLVSDPDFQKTDFLVSRKQNYLDELKAVFDEIKAANGLPQIGGDEMSNILSFAKTLKQEIKISEKLKKCP